MQKLQNKKAGLNGIPPEVWKTGKYNDLPLYYCNEVYKGNVVKSWTEGCILPFPKKGGLGKTSNYKGINLTSIAAKIYIALPLDSVHRGMMEKILLEYGIPKEIVTAIIVLHRNTKLRSDPQVETHNFLILVFFIF